MQHDDTRQVEHARLEEQLAALKDQVHALQEAQRRGASRWSQARIFVMGAVIALAGGAMTAAAQTVADQLRTFSAGQPALASDVNWNFSLLEQWIEHKIGDASTPIVTHTDSVRHSCPSCGSASALDGNENWGTLTMQGRVISTNSNLHLSPPSGFNVVIDDTYRAAGGSSAGVAGLSVEGGISSGGALVATGELTTQGKTLANHIRDYVRTQCAIHFGWSDGCDGGCDGAPAKYGSSRPDGTCTGILGVDSECVAGSGWIGINVDGDVDNNDKFFARLVCN